MNSELLKTLLNFVSDYKVEKEEQGFIPTLDLLIQDLEELIK